ncbi:hypothetical protein [Chlorobium phaeobacteroides]|uniref:Uncharacterized protein n=1 Tax=Chlorobium phaeobacteroides (strain DSM 266 / SMG 266 / 2430) TaxID=290317 RepID=A1BJY5_CHLPD|nr:hypothetical protein [Chlorobium phaeobacteroides]ABL66712.1 conserved hypothetical protein [Chlorobium phaeobacteroides DSM 266]
MQSDKDKRFSLSQFTGILKTGWQGKSDEKTPQGNSPSDRFHDGGVEPELEIMNDVPPAQESLRKSTKRSFGFDIGDVLQLRTFFYLFVITVIFLFQTHNTIAIKNLAMQNEILREQLQMSASVITAQELKASELQSIHNITECTGALGLQASSVPAVELAVP